MLTDSLSEEESEGQEALSGGQTCVKDSEVQEALSGGQARVGELEVREALSGDQTGAGESETQEARNDHTLVKDSEGQEARNDHTLVTETHNRDHTYVEVNLDLDNPIVPEDNEEAKERFCEAMKASVESLKRSTSIPSFLQQLHEEKRDSAAERRESLVGGIAEAIERARIVGKKGASSGLEQAESISSLSSSLSIHELERNCGQLPASQIGARKSQEKRSLSLPHEVESPSKEVKTN